MMLLAAVVLLIAFLSLSVMVSRVSIVASETARAGEDGFLREVKIVGGALAMPTQPSMAVLASFEAQRGFSLTCSGGVATLTDGLSTAVFPGVTC